MKDSQILLNFFKEFIQNKVAMLIVLLSTIAGAVLGALAFYNGWLG